MIFYLFYSLIFNLLFKMINIKYIYIIINIIFYNTNNKIFFIAILISFIIKIFKKEIKKTKIMCNIKIFLLIIIDILKMIFISYNLYLIIISLILSVLYLLIERTQKIKILVITSYIFTPISLYYVANILEYKNSTILFIPSIIMLLIKLKPQNILLVDIKTLIGFIIILLFSLNININTNKKRNIFWIFLIIIYLIYYKVVS